MADPSSNTDSSKPAQHAITDDVYLYTTRTTTDTSPVFTYEVECCKFNRSVVTGVRAGVVGMNGTAD